ncbi:MAG: phosphate--acyl-ACP acyltransferase, partial [Gemmatimonadetes bacterium]|nr:phosphate--acyl-ACP acyltransferase [Gemmatimonadota bacterium]
FQTAEVNFIGNVESNALFHGAADVAVCDGFVGNVILKFAESMVEWLGGMVREEIEPRPMAKVGALFLKPVIGVLKQKLSYEEYGGAPLLGVDGITIICHGRSSAKAIENAVHTAARFVRHDINNEIKSKLKHASEVTVE